MIIMMIIIIIIIITITKCLKITFLKKNICMSNRFFFFYKQQNLSCALRDFRMKTFLFVANLVFHGKRIRIFSSVELDQQAETLEGLLRNLFVLVRELVGMIGNYLQIINKIKNPSSIKQTTRNQTPGVWIIDDGKQTTAVKLQRVINVGLKKITAAFYVFENKTWHPTDQLRKRGHECHKIFVQNQQVFCLSSIWRDLMTCLFGLLIH